MSCTGCHRRSVRAPDGLANERLKKKKKECLSSIGHVLPGASQQMLSGCIAKAPFSVHTPPLLGMHSMRHVDTSGDRHGSMCYMHFSPSTQCQGSGDGLLLILRLAAGICGTVSPVKCLMQGKLRALPHQPEVSTLPNNRFPSQHIMMQLAAGVGLHCT